MCAPNHRPSEQQASTMTVTTHAPTNRPNTKLDLLEAGGEQQLVGLELEVAQDRRAGDRRGDDHADQRQDHDGGVDHVRGVDVDRPADAADAHRRAGDEQEAEEEHHRHEHVVHGAAQVVAQLEAGEAEELAHAALRAARVIW
jgi:hypothetical protein